LRHPDQILRKLLIQTLGIDKPNPRFEKPAAGPGN